MSDAERRVRLRQMMAEADCDTADAAERLATALQWPVSADVSSLSCAVLTAARSELAAQARRALRRQVAALLGLAIVSMPLSLAFGGYMIQRVYDVASAILPAGVALYLVGTYAMIALALFGATYAAIPILVGQARDRFAYAHAGEVSR